jgi:CBS domain-containing protein
MAEITTTVRQVLDRKGGKTYSVTPETRVFDALRLMAEHDIGAVLVTDAQGLSGIFTERDYSRKLALRGLSSRDAQVAHLMTTDVATVPSSEKVSEVMVIMTNRRFRHLPVVDEGKLVGIITIGDVVKAVIDEQEATIRQLASYIAGDLTT